MKKLFALSLIALILTGIYLTTRRMGTVVVPPYTGDCVEFASAEPLCAEYPEHTELIRSLTRSA